MTDTRHNFYYNKESANIKMKRHKRFVPLPFGRVAKRFVILKPTENEHGKDEKVAMFKLVQIPIIYQKHPVKSSRVDQVPIILRYPSHFFHSSFL